MLHDLQDRQVLGSLTTIWYEFSDAWDTTTGFVNGQLQLLFMDNRAPSLSACTPPPHKKKRAKSKVILFVDLVCSTSTSVFLPFAPLPGRQVRSSLHSLALDSNDP